MPLKYRYTYQEAVKDALKLKGRIDFVDEDDNQVHTEDIMNDREIDAPQLVDNDEVITTELVVFTRYCTMRWRRISRCHCLADSPSSEF
jgi:hypothetical protein